MRKHLYKKKTQKMIWIVLCILVLPAFVLWGMGSADRSREQSTEYIGKIYGKNITFVQYREALEATRNFALMQFGENFSKIEQMLNLKGQAWDRLILLAEARKRRIKVSDQEVVNTIKGYPFLQQKGGFNERAYNQIVKYYFNSQPRVFEEQVRQNLLISKLYERVSKDVKITDAEIKEEYKKENEKISIDYIYANPLDFAKDVIVTDWLLQDYFNKNSVEFKQPPSYNLEYLQPVSGDESNNMLFHLKKGDSFEKIAADFNQAIKETGLFSQLDPIPEIGYSQELMDIISKTKIKDVLPPLLIYNKYYLIRIKEKKDSFIPDFEAIKDKIKDSLTQGKARELAKTKIEDYLKKIKELPQNKLNTATFNSIAQEYGLKSGTTQLFSYKDSLKDLGQMDIFFIGAKNLKESELSPIITALSGFYVARKKEFVSIDEGKFEKEKTEFSKIILSDKKQEYFNKIFGELKRKAQEY